MGKKKNRQRNKVYKKYQVNETKAERIQALRSSKKLLKELDKPRNKIHPTFTAEFDSNECPRCFSKIEKGDRVRYNEDDILVHAIHRSKEIQYEICDRCFLARPCEHDES